MRRCQRLELSNSVKSGMTSGWKTIKTRHVDFRVEIMPFVMNIKDHWLLIKLLLNIFQRAKKCRAYFIFCFVFMNSCFMVTRHSRQGREAFKIEKIKKCENNLEPHPPLVKKCEKFHTYLFFLFWRLTEGRDKFQKTMSRRSQDFLSWNLAELHVWS